MEMNGKKLLDALLDDETTESVEQTDVEEYDGPTVDGCLCRFPMDEGRIDWSSFDIKLTTEMLQSLSVARFNLMTADNLEERIKIADSIIKDTNHILSAIGFGDMDYAPNDNITRFESALMAISDCIAIYTHIIHLCEINQLKTEIDELETVIKVHECESDCEEEDVYRATIGMSENEAECAKQLAESFKNDYENENKVDSFVDDHLGEGLVSE